MNLKEFVDSYNLNDLNIIKTIYQNNQIILYLSFDIDMPFIANGCRPTFDYQAVHEFIFNNQLIPCKNIDKPQIVKSFSYNKSLLKIVTDADEIIINDCDINIKSNIII